MRPVWELPLHASGVLIELDSGRVVRIRPVRPEDRPELRAAFERFSEKSRYYRFFSPRPRLGDQLESALVDIDHVTHHAWAVFDPEAESDGGGDSGLAIGVCRLISDTNDTTAAEAALSVVDAYQRMGIGRFMIELLVATAADLGIETLHFEVLTENNGVRGLLSGLGATSHAIADDQTVLEFRLAVPAVTNQDLAAGALYELLRRAARGSDKNTS